MDLKDLYRDVILDHNKHPRNFGTLEQATAEADGHNALCGDRLHVALRLEDDRIEDVRFVGKGCAISVASASLMTEAIRGRSRAEFGELFGTIHALLTQPEFVPARDIGKLAALSGVREFPARVKCASLCWHTAHAALERTATTVSTE